MNKKLKIRLILAVVLCTWGYNIYRLVQNKQIQEELEELTSHSSDFTFNPAQFRKDSFELVLPDVDPFLKTRSDKQTEFVQEDNDEPPHQSTGNHHSNHLKTEVIDQPKVWPQISYFGFVKNHSRDNALCLIKIDGTMFKVSEGDQKRGVLISNVFRDSVVMIFEGSQKTISKS